MQVFRTAKWHSWLLALVCVGIGAAAVVVGLFGLRLIRPAGPCGPRSFGRDVADAVRLYDPKTGLDCIRIASCRLEKRKMGPLTLGGLNILVLQDVVLNLPLPIEVETNLVQAVRRGGTVSVPSAAGGTRSVPSAAGGTGSVPSAAASKMPLDFLSGLIPASARASGIRIAGLSVNRVADGRVVPMFAADELRNRGRVLALAGCRVFEGGATNLVGEATLTLGADAALTWKNGRLGLSLLTSHFSLTPKEH